MSADFQGLDRLWKVISRQGQHVVWGFCLLQAPEHCALVVDVWGGLEGFSQLGGLLLGVLEKARVADLGQTKVNLFAVVNLAGAVGLSLGFGLR